MRERWWGATGRRVPEIAVESELLLEEAVVLDGVDNAEILRQAHGSGKPVVVPDAKRDLLELDLTKLTYG